MPKMKRKPVIDEEDVFQEVKNVENKIDKTPLKELPEGDLTLDDKLFEIKKAIEASRNQTFNGLKHLEKKIDYIFNMISGKIPKR